MANGVASYGSLSRFRQVPRMAALGETLIGASGDISDFQYIMKELEDMKCVSILLD